jgi:limonene 1,2-monooxygenase
VYHIHEFRTAGWIFAEEWMMVATSTPALPTRGLRFGAFVAPFHSVRENPTLALERDLELVEHLDRLAFNEVWIGEHHSSGLEVIASPELFIAMAAGRTKHIRLGTGVSSLSYHHPLVLADRINQLDHMTRGRVMFGVGPGSLPTDAYMMGITVASLRDRMDEAIDVLVPLLRGETVTARTNWFTLEEAMLQLTPYTHPSVEIAVASTVSPTGARAAGKHGLGMLSIGATSRAGFNALASNWAIAEQQAAAHSTQVQRAGWRLVGPMHIAETREEARRDVRFGLDDDLTYFREVAALPMAPNDPNVDPVDALNDSGMAVIGTVEDAIAQIERLWAQSGGFGAFLLLDHNWANWEAKRKSYELIARYVTPHFHGSNRNRETSFNWSRDNHKRIVSDATGAINTRIEQHVKEAGGANVAPELRLAAANEKER